MSKKLSPEKLMAISHRLLRYVEGRLLLDHIQVLEHELKTAKEDEEAAVARFGEAEMNVVRLKQTVDHLKSEKKILENKLAPYRVKVPADVYEAFNTSLRVWRQRFTEEQIAGFLLNPDGFRSHSETASVLKRFARTSPIQYTLAIANGYIAEQSPDDHVFEQYIQFCDNGQYEVADGVLMAIEKLAPGKTELIEKMRAVERLPF